MHPDGLRDRHAPKALATAWVIDPR